MPPYAATQTLTKTNAQQHTTTELLQNRLRADTGNAWPELRNV